MRHLGKVKFVYLLTLFTVIPAQAQLFYVTPNKIPDLISYPITLKCVLLNKGRLYSEGTYTSNAFTSKNREQLVDFMKWISEYQASNNYEINGCFKLQDADTDENANPAPMYARRTFNIPSEVGQQRVVAIGSAKSTSTSSNKANLVAGACLVPSAAGRSYYRNRCTFPITISYCVLNPNNAFTCLPKPLPGSPYVGRGSTAFRAGQEQALATGAGQLDSYTGGFKLRYFACRNVPGTSAFLTQADPPKGVCR